MTQLPTRTPLQSTCIAWSLSRHIDAQLPLQALEMALDYVPPDELKLKYSMCEHLSGLDFLGAFHMLNHSEQTGLLACGKPLEC